MSLYELTAVKVKDNMHYTGDAHLRGWKNWSDFLGQQLSLPFTLPGCNAVMPMLTDLDQWVLRICLDCRGLGKRTVHHLNGIVLIVVQKRDTRLQ